MGSAMAKRLSVSWIVLHWAAILLVLLSLGSGFRIAILDKPWLLWLSPILPQGALHWLHVASGCGLTVIALFYVMRQVLKKNNRPSGERTFIQVYHRLVTWFGYVVVLVAVITGWLFALDRQGWVPYPDLHFLAALGMAAYILLHGGGYFIQFGYPVIKRIVLPDHNRWGLNGLIIVFGLAAALAVWSNIDLASGNVLTVSRIPMDTFIDIDGSPDEAAWQKAEAFTVLTHGGANFGDGTTPVHIKALENGVEAFFHISWRDPTRSLKHLPLIKTAQGWRVQQNGFYRFDETDYYEDKLAVMLSDECQYGGAGTAHLGPRPLPNQPANWHGKGYHYAEDGKVRDIWHWKAVRTNNMFLADDNFFGAPVQARAGERRYKAGYVTDSKTSGAYVMNWRWYTQDRVIPKRLPETPEAIAPYQSPADKVPDSGDASALSWVIPWFDYNAHQAEEDRFPPGTVMPSVLYRSNRFEGDRADVRARGVWEDGSWSLELSRRLITGSEHDVPIDDGICLWVSAFDQSQVAHTRHQRGILLSFEGADD